MESLTSYDVKDFAADVLQRSFERPVMVDFWAEWCGPCKVLGPTLERMAEKADGRWELRKLNTEEFPDVAAQYDIRSIPNVKMFAGGKVIDEFVGALPEQAISHWLERALPDPSEEELDNAEAFLVSGQRESAAEVALAVLDRSPENERARSIAAAALVFRDPRRAYQLVADMDEGSRFWERAGSAREISRLLSKANSPESLPDSPVKTRYLEALRSLADEEFDRALGAFIEVIREDRAYENDESRKACIAIFKFLGEEHEITIKHRRDFGNALYV